MRKRRAAGQALAAAVTLALAAAMAAAAAQPVSRLDLSNLAGTLPPPADTGKPLLPPPPAVPPSPDRCLPALPCGTMLRGEIRKDGAVELQVPALHW